MYFTKQKKTNKNQQVLKIIEVIIKLKPPNVLRGVYIIYIYIDIYR